MQQSGLSDCILDKHSIFDWKVDDKGINDRRIKFRFVSCGSSETMIRNTVFIEYCSRAKIESKITTTCCSWLVALRSVLSLIRLHY